MCFISTVCFFLDSANTDCSFFTCTPVIRNKMFSISSQKRSWMFADQDEVDSLRRDANEAFITLHRQETDVSVRIYPNNLRFAPLFTFSVHSQDVKVFTHFLSVDEEKALFRFYMSIMKDFCRSFQPPMPEPVKVIYRYKYSRLVFFLMAFLLFAGYCSTVSQKVLSQ